MMLSVTAYSQWEVGNYVDEFGLKTGEVFVHQTVQGIFSNSATTNSKCSYFIEHDKKTNVFGITIYPYGGRSKETWFDDTFQEVKIKKPSGEVGVVEAFCFDGVIYFSEKEYTQLMEVMKERGEYRFAMRHKTDYSKSTYSFKFNY